MVASQKIKNKNLGLPQTTYNPWHLLGYNNPKLLPSLTHFWNLQLSKAHLKGSGLEPGERAANSEVQFHARIHRAGLVPVGGPKGVKSLQNGPFRDRGEMSAKDSLEEERFEIEVCLLRAK